MKVFGLRNRNVKCVDENKTDGVGGADVRKPPYELRRPLERRTSQKSVAAPTLLLAKRDENVLRQKPPLVSHKPADLMTVDRPSAPKRKILGGGNTLVSVEYAEDICNYLLYLEGVDVLAPDFLAGLPHGINGRMRQILVDWMVLVQCRFELHNETLSLAVWMLDRCLIGMAGFSQNDLQLLGAACMFVASKFEEILAPCSQDIVVISAELFTRKELFTMEQQVIKTINFRGNAPHAYHFLKQYHGCLKASKEVYNLAKFICDVAMITYELCHHRPSVTGAIALFLAAHILEQEIASESLRAVVVDLPADRIAEMARQYAPFVLQYGRRDYRLGAIREKYQRLAPLPFRDVHVKRIQSLISAGK